MSRTSTSLGDTGRRPTTPFAEPTAASSDRGAHAWRQQAAWMFAAYVVMHSGAAALVNDWEGWSNFAGNFVVVAIWGLALTGLTFGVLVRWGLKDSPKGRNRAALASLGAGIASVVAYAIYFMWAPFVVAPAAVILAAVGIRTAREGDRGGRKYAVAGGVMGALSATYWIFCIVFALTTGSFPLPGSQ